MNSRWKNYGLWFAVIALVLDILIYSGVPIVAEDWKVFANRFLEVLVLAGIISNPTTTNQWYTDDK